MKKFNLLFSCLLLSVVISFSFSSCNDDDDIEKTQKKLIPVKIIREGWELSFEYDSEYRIIKKVEKDGDETSSVSFEYDVNGKLQKEIHNSFIATYTYSKDTVFVEEVGYSYIDTLIINDKNQIVKSLNYGVTTFQYNADGTLLSKESESSSSDGSYKFLGTYKYTYDKKKGAFANVNILSWHIPRMLEDIYLGNISNVIQEEWTYNRQGPDSETTDSEKSILSYSYNENGYPTEGKLIVYNKDGEIKEELETVSIHYIEKK